ncbi:MAG TPA: DUF1579 domain-containing protein [Reyranella sp.]|nr:DUF1579 domain-containing protein [Reyranella sp.]
MALPCRKPSPDFDFFMGIWTCRHRYLRRRLAGCNDWIEFDGSCAARRILDGYGNMDEADIALPGDRYRGMSLRTYDPDRDRWSIYWLDSRRPGFLFPPVVGGFDKGIGTFYGDDEHDGRAIRVRFLWSRITPQSARWEQAFSLDEGNSWETNWTMDFTRM